MVISSFQITIHVSLSVISPYLLYNTAINIASNNVFIVLAILRDDCSLAITDIVLEACMLLIYHFNVFYIIHHIAFTIWETERLTALL